jgi:MoaA/NifB/PqqE/SkfB family radical SAM enzyme
MANLSISTICSLNCPYCFTADYLDDVPDGRRFMPLDEFDARLDFLDRSGIDEARLLGGEPTLHPDFPALVARALDRDKRIVVFSNGLMPNASLNSLADAPADRCFVLMNINAPADNGSAVITRQIEALRRLGERAMPGFNIYRPDFDLGFLLDLIEQTGCKPSIRLGIAQPCLSGDNRYIHPKQYRFIGQQIAAFTPIAAARGVTLEFDCGFVRCMFTDQEIQTLHDANANVGWRCNPILDVDVYGQVIQCYPLSRLGSLPLTPDIDAPALRKTFEARTGAYRHAGIYPECAICPFKASGECSGGCLAAGRQYYGVSV